MTADYKILLPDESMVLATIQRSTAKKFVDDPVCNVAKIRPARTAEAIQLPDER